MLKFYNSSSINKAQEQQKQILYFINSSIEDNRLDDNYIKQWAERNYQNSDYFLNWIKSIFKTENFLNFYKFLRKPLPSAKLVKNDIEPQLKRVFNAEDAYYKYEVQGKEQADYIQDLDIKDFNTMMFEALLYYPNSIIVSDLDDYEANKAHRYIVNIDRVRSINEKKGKIQSVVFDGYGYDEIGKKQEGLIYIDSEKYALYKDQTTLIREQSHDLGYCPVHFVTDRPFSDDWIVKESLFSFIREELEEYVFLKTLQKMSNGKGAFPVVTKLATDDVTDEKSDLDSNIEPSSSEAMSSQRGDVYRTNPPNSSGDVDGGTIHNVPVQVNDDGTINMDVVTNYLNFFYFPVDILTFINQRISEVRRSIISTIIGDVVDSSEESKNELQIKKSISVLENVLRSFATKLDRIRTLSDTDMLSLEFGKDMVQEVVIHYGTDFFLETQEQLTKELNEAANPLERKNIIVRMNQNKYKNNYDVQMRQKLLYDIIPYVHDKDYEKAGDSITPENKELYIRFNYWISHFEAQYGDIVEFYKDAAGTKAEKLELINSLIISLIQNSKTNETTN